MRLLGLFITLLLQIQVMNGKVCLKWLSITFAVYIAVNKVYIDNFTVT